MYASRIEKNGMGFVSLSLSLSCVVWLSGYHFLSLRTLYEVVSGGRTLRNEGEFLRNLCQQKNEMILEVFDFKVLRSMTIEMPNEKRQYFVFTTSSLSAPLFLY